MIHSVVILGEGDPCPKCVEGELVIRMNRQGGIDEKFLGCSEWPECDFTAALEVWARRDEGGE